MLPQVSRLSRRIRSPNDQGDCASSYGYSHHQDISAPQGIQEGWKCALRIRKIRVHLKSLVKQKCTSKSWQDKCALQDICMQDRSAEVDMMEMHLKEQEVQKCTSRSRQGIGRLEVHFKKQARQSALQVVSRTDVHFEKQVGQKCTSRSRQN